MHISPAIKASYYCRATVAGLLRQTWATGSEILPTLRRNSRALSSRHLVPGLAVVAAALMLVGIAGLPDEPARWLLHVTAASALAYVTLAVAAAIQLARHSGAATALLSCLLFPLVHFTYGAGTLAGLLKVPGARRRAPLPVVQNRVA